jgi:hypothetical protein
VSEPACAALRDIKFLDYLEVRLHYWHDNHLGNPVARIYRV